ncbi:MAG: hypothetical protein H0W73_11095 [Bacteroidetes bacterium]|nr:hypothetical protein [Bacteroidota bacterium]
MKKILTLTYVIATAIVAIVTTIMQIQPALFLIELMAPDEGDKFSVKLVFLLTWLILLSPFIVVVTVLFFMRRAADAKVVIMPNQTGVWISRKRQLQSGLVGVPVYINGNKAGVVDNGREKFFEVSKGSLIIWAGEGKGASEKNELMINGGQQLKLHLELVPKGLIVQHVLTAK